MNFDNNIGTPEVNFERWNKELLKYFFPLSQNKTVRLNLDFDLLDTYFEELGGHESFLQAVQTGPSFIKNHDLYDKALRLHKLWRFYNNRPSEYMGLVNEKDEPPYLAYLCLLCLAWNVTSDKLGANAYYGRLDQIYPHHGITAQNFARWEPLWQSLRKWATDNNRGTVCINQLGMRYVGIPKGQVIFTPQKTQSFATYLSQIHAHPKDTIDELAGKILNHEAYSRNFLGHGLYSKMTEGLDEESLGKGALDQLYEFLGEWDGRQRTRISTSNNSGRGRRAAPLTHYVDHLLRYQRNANNWELGYVINNDELDLSEGISSDGYSLANIFSRTGDYSFVKQDGRFRAISISDPPLDINVHTQETGIHINLRSKSPSILFFQNFLSNKYIAESTFSETDEGYFLCSNKKSQQLAEWFRNKDLKVDERETSVDSHKLFHLQGLNALSDDSWEEYAQLSGSPMRPSRTSQRRIRLHQGTRTRRTGAYLDFDLPLVEIRDSHLLREDSPECRGGRLIPMRDDIADTGTSASSYLYEVTADANTECIAIKAQFHDSADTEEAHFYIELPPENPTDSLTDYTGIDEFGQPAYISSKSEALRGASAPPSAAPANPEFDIVNELDPDMKKMNECYLSTYKDHTGYKFLTALATEVQQRKVSIRHGFEIAHRLLDCHDFDRRSFYRQLRHLRDLGYLEIGCDRKNRWTHIIPCPSGYNLLPSKLGNSFCLVPTGVYHLNKLVRLLQEYPNTYSDVSETDADNQELIPPRIIIVAKDTEMPDGVKRSYGTPSSNAQNILDYAADLDKWESSLKRAPLTHYPHNRAGYYEPNKFRRQYTNEKRHGTGWLEFYEDPETGVHQVFRLYRRHPYIEKEQFYAIIRDPSWARWWMHDREGVSPVYSPSNEDEDGEFITLIGYKANDRSLWIPRYLDLPRILRRALVLCSSTPPASREAHESYPIRKNARSCVVYSNIPRFIANELAQKLHASIHDFGPSN